MRRGENGKGEKDRGEGNGEERREGYGEGKWTVGG